MTENPVGKVEDSPLLHNRSSSGSATDRQSRCNRKIRHRTLYTANKDRNCPNTKCLACRTSEESIKHLAECSEIRYEFWWDILNLMRILKLNYSRTPVFLLLGITEDNKIVCKEGAAIIAIGWRCLYAEITRARIEGTEIKINQALRRTFAMLISRVKAYGEKWKLWYNKQRLQTHARIIAEKYRQLTLILQTFVWHFVIGDVCRYCSVCRHTRSICRCDISSADML